MERQAASFDAQNEADTQKRITHMIDDSGRKPTVTHVNSVFLDFSSWQLGTLD